MTMLILPNPMNAPTLIGVDVPAASVATVPVSDLFTNFNRPPVTAIDHWTLVASLAPMFDTSAFIPIGPFMLPMDNSARPEPSTIAPIPHRPSTDGSAHHVIVASYLGRQSRFYSQHVRTG